MHAALVLLVDAGHFVDLLNRRDGGLGLGLHLLEGDAVQDVLAVFEGRAVLELSVVIHDGVQTLDLWVVDPLGDRDWGGLQLTGNLGVLHAVAIEHQGVALHRSDLMLGRYDGAFDVSQVLIELFVAGVVWIEEKLRREILVRVGIFAVEVGEQWVHVWSM